MPKAVVHGGKCECDQGILSSDIAVVDPTVVIEGSVLMANINDCQVEVNIQNFLLCISMDNPDVKNATNAAGFLVPQPCEPIPMGPWAPGFPTMFVRGANGLSPDSTMMCQWKGAIKVSQPGQSKLDVS